MQLSPELQKRLLNVLDALAKGFEEHQEKKASHHFVKGLGTMALALPVVVLQGLPSALSLLFKHGLPHLQKGYEEAKTAKNIDDFRKKSMPRPTFRPKPRP